MQKVHPNSKFSFGSPQIPKSIMKPIS